MSYKKQTAFTLIELSIVLVIIGLIIGGIMLGRTLIQQAEIRAAATQLQKLEAGYHTFRTKYNCIIGDCANASEFFGSSYASSVTTGCPPSGGASNGNGNGDGFIDDAGYGANWTCEPAQAAKSLHLAGLLPTALETPCSTSDAYFLGINDGCAYFYKDDRYSSITNPLRTNAITWNKVSMWGIGGGSLSPSDANSIDQKIDDGKPTTGKFRGRDHAPGGAVLLGTCIRSFTTEYSTSTSIGCRTLYYIK